MNRELAAYLRIQASVSAAFSFFIGGMAAALIYHKADFVPAGAISTTIDITITCLLTFAITTPFCRASLHRDKILGVFAAKTPPTRLLARLFRRPVLLVVSLSLCAAPALSALTALFFALLGVAAVPFYLYIVLKSVFSAMLGAFATCAVFMPVCTVQGKL
ncbi:MAG: hypothetical protein ACOX1J_03890 [Dethiobacteria bacterium]|jgi:hypothetical protein